MGLCLSGQLAPLTMREFHILGREFVAKTPPNDVYLRLRSAPHFRQLLANCRSLALSKGTSADPLRSSLLLFSQRYDMGAGHLSRGELR